MNENQYPNGNQPQGQWQQQQWQQQSPMDHPLQQPQKSNAGLIIGIVVGGIIFIMLLMLLAIVPSLRKYMKKAEEAEQYVLTHNNSNGFDEDYFASYQWEGVNDPALIIPEDDGTFIWYRDGSDKDGDYYSGTYELYVGEEAIEYLTTESEVSDKVTEDDIKDIEDPEYGATDDNFVCLVMTNEKEVHYGVESEYEGDDQVTSTLYGFYVNDRDGNKLTLVQYGNPYEFNLAPKTK